MWCIDKKSVMLGYRQGRKEPISRGTKFQYQGYIQKGCLAGLEYKFEATETFN